MRLKGKGGNAFKAGNTSEAKNRAAPPSLGLGAQAGRLRGDFSAPPPADIGGRLAGADV